MRLCPLYTIMLNLILLKYICSVERETWYGIVVVYLTKSKAR